MENQEGLGKLSPEQIQKLAGTISEAKNLTGQQEEIIKRVLAGETEIGNLRISSLEKYFDIYSKSLDLVARKHSALSDTFLILEEKLTNNYEKLSSDVTKLEEQLANLSKQSKEISRAGTASDVRPTSAARQENAIKSDGKHLELLSNLLGEFRELRSFITANGDSIPYSAAQEIAESQVSATNEQTRYVESTGGNNAIDTIDTAEVHNYTSEFDRARLEEAAKNIDNTRKLEQAVADTVAQLREIMAIQSGSSEEKDISRERARAINIDADLKAAKQLEDEIAAYRLKLNNETMLKTGSALTAEQAAANEELVRQAFSNIDERLAEIKAQNVKNAVAQADPKLAAIIEDNEKKRIAALAKLELQHKKKNHGEMTALEEQAHKDKIARINKEYELSEERLEELQKKQEKELAKQKHQDINKKVSAAVTAPLSSENSILDRLIALNEARKEEAKDREGLGNQFLAGLSVAISAISSLAKDLEKSVDAIAMSKSAIDTRLQGSKNATVQGLWGEKSYWDQLVKDMASVGAVTPYFKQEKFAENIKTLVDQGIAFDLKQRAFLMTIQEKIATTFNVADGTLLRLIRIQQEDSTAGRLGMESALNSFLNNMYENTEYLKTVADGVRNSLQEMEALMTGAEASEVEYQVQKWMGSLYSVGMSSEAVNSIATALGQLAAGQVDALTNGSGAGNLLVMAANEAGKSISDILINGLNAKDTNDLLQATVNYLAELAEASKDNRVVQQQLANVYGIKASDLRAATNLASDKTIDNIYQKYLTYDNMLKQLNDMAGTMYQRTSLGEMMQNVWANGMYTLAGSMSSNPISYLLYKGATLLDDAVGGIDFSIPLVFGSGTAQTFNVADIMRVGALGSGILGSLSSIISGLSSSFNGQAMLANMGIEQGSGLKITPRGNGGIGASDMQGAKQSTSGSGYVGNASSSDIKNSTIQSTEENAKQQMIEAKEEAEATQIDFINTNVLKIYELLDEVANGKRSLSVKVAGYGLTNLGSNTSLNGAQAGVAGLLSNNAANNSSNNPLGGGFTSGGNYSGSSGSGHSSGSVNSGSSSSGSDGFGSTSSIDLGGWTIM